MSLEVVFFDLGGVLVDVDLNRSRRLWEDFTTLPPDAFDAAFFGSGLKDRMDLGEVTADRVAPEVNRLAGTALSEAQLREIWNACILPRPEALALAGRVSERVRLGVISDTDALHARFMREDCGLDSLGAIWTTSFEVGRKKPDPLIYDAALGRLAVAPGDALFIDDRLPNVEGARKVGMQAEVSLEVATLASILAQHGLL